jgi:hypothetical protein
METTNIYWKQIPIIDDSLDTLKWIRKFRVENGHN